MVVSSCRSCFYSSKVQLNKLICLVYQTVSSYLPRKSCPSLSTSNKLISTLLAFLKWAPRKKTVNDLPYECLAHIFCQTLCPSGSPNYAPTFTPFFSAECRQDPFLLGQVCRKWRIIALRASELWCSITIIHPDPCHVHRAELWMQRSGGRAISITLRQSPHPTVVELDATQVLLALFSTRADVWQSIDLVLNGQFPYIILPRLRDLSGKQTCKLIEVTLSLHSRLPAPPAQEWDVPVAHLWNLLQSIPSIVSFKWDAAVVGSSRVGNNLNFVDIKAPISMEMLLSNVIHSPETLQNVVIHKLSLPSSYPLYSIEPTIYPHLTVLDITATTFTSDISSLLRSLTLPSLTYLTLAYVEHNLIVHVADLIHRSRCTINVFAIKIPNFTESEIMEWLNLEGLKQITCLILEGPITNNVLRAFHRPAQYGHQVCYFPNLRRLGLGRCVATIDNDLLLRMLGSRLWSLPYITGPQLPATELELACITVHEVTAKHEAYAAMIKQTTQGTSRGLRELEILA